MTRTKTIISAHDAEMMADDFNFKWVHLSAIGLEVIACTGDTTIEVVYKLHHQHRIEAVPGYEAINMLMTIQDLIAQVEKDAREFRNYEIDWSLDD